MLYELLLKPLASYTRNSVLVITCITFFTYCYFQLRIRKREKNEPPLVSGRPVIGSGKEFKENAVNLLRKCTDMYGDMFTLRMTPRGYVHYLMDPFSIDAMWKERNFSFGEVCRQVNLHAFQFHNPSNFDHMTSAVGKTTQFPLYLQYMDEGLMTFYQSAKSWQDGKVLDFAINTHFRASFNTYFGRNDDKPFNYLTVQENCVKYNVYFTFLWFTGAPLKLVPTANKYWTAMTKAHPPIDEQLKQEDLGEYIRFVINHMRVRGHSDEEIKGHNIVTMHINYNTTKACFWVLVHLMQSAEGLDAVRTELNEAIHKKKEKDEGSVIFNERDLEYNMPYLDSVVSETLRLRSGVFMIRHILETTDFTLSSGSTYSLRKGDQVAVYTTAMHLDPDVFKDPMVFKYDRFYKTEFFKNGKKLFRPLLAHGNLCPGEKLSMIQIKWLVLNCVNMFDMEMVGEPPQCDYSATGYEILPPLSDVDFKFRSRSDVLDMSFVPMEKNWL